MTIYDKNMDMAIIYLSKFHQEILLNYAAVDYFYYITKYIK